MTDIVDRLRNSNQAADTPFDQLDAERMEAAAEIERLRGALQALHDWYVEYARINNLFNDDGSPGTFHELLEARRVLAALDEQVAQ